MKLLKLEEIKGTEVLARAIMTSNYKLYHRGKMLTIIPLTAALAYVISEIIIL